MTNLRGELEYKGEMFLGGGVNLLSLGAEQSGEESPSITVCLYVSNIYFLTHGSLKIKNIGKTCRYLLAHWCERTNEFD